jgi:hypothetical protein
MIVCLVKRIIMKVTFEEYLCNVFAECAFLTEAAENGSNAMACLEAYDEAYTTVESILDA